MPKDMKVVFMPPEKSDLDTSYLKKDLENPPQYPKDRTEEQKVVDEFLSTQVREVVRQVNDMCEKKGISYVIALDYKGVGACSYHFIEGETPTTFREALLIMRTGIVSYLKSRIIVFLETMARAAMAQTNEEEEEDDRNYGDTLH